MKRPQQEIIDIFNKKRETLPKSTLQWIRGDIPVLSIANEPLYIAGVSNT